MSAPVVALVQARMASRRFPGKMMADLAGYPLLRWVLERVRRSRRLDETVLATTGERGDDVLAGLARDLGVAVFRGPTDDVLGRFAEAASRHGAGTVVRVCADNPLVAPEAIDRAVDAFVTRRPDYAFNHVPRLESRYPDGIGAEVLGADLLLRLESEARAPDEREHVTARIWNHPQRFAILAVDCPDAWAARGQPIRLDVDRPQDLDTLRALCRDLDFGATVDDVLTCWRQRHGSEAALQE